MCDIIRQDGEAVFYLEDIMEPDEYRKLLGKFMVETVKYSRDNNGDIERDIHIELLKDYALFRYEADIEKAYNWAYYFEDEVSRRAMSLVWHDILEKACAKASIEE